MRLEQQTMSRLLAPLLILPAALRVNAHPYPKDELHDAGYSFVMPRECAHYCGLDNEFCCGANEPCYTTDGIETCGGGYALITQRAIGVYTTTWTETHTYTSTVTTDWNPVIPVDTTVPCTPKNADESPCGYLCCAWFQDCGSPGQCVNKPGYVDVGGGGGGGGGGNTIIYTSVYTTDGVAVTTGYSAPYRVHGSSTVTPGATGAVETTPEPEGTAGGGLSAGAIAGIVIGVLVGIGLLILICFCCIVRGLWHAICGGKKKKDHRDEYYSSEEYVGHHGSSRHSRRDNHSSWYGSHPPKEKHDHHGKGWLGLAALAGTILALLNMRKKDKKKKQAHSRRSTRHSDSYYSDPSGSSRSGSSGRRTHYTRRTGRSGRSQPSRR